MRAEKRGPEDFDIIKNLAGESDGRLPSFGHSIEPVYTRISSVSCPSYKVGQNFLPSLWCTGMTAGTRFRIIYCAFCLGKVIQERILERGYKTSKRAR